MMEPGNGHGAARRHPLLLYFLIAFALTWSIAVPLALDAQGVLHLPRAIHYLAQFGPAVAAIIVTALSQGTPGLRDLARRILKWRVGVRWWLISAGSPIAFLAVAVVVARIVNGEWVNLWDFGKVNFLPALGPAALLLWLVTNGFGEETGWRGFALPRLQRTHSALIATLILACFWALWHVPAFFYLPTYRETGVSGVPGFFLGLLSGAILLTWLYNSTGGSILMVGIWHGLFNFFTASTAVSDTVQVVFSVEVMVLAVVLVILERPANLATRPRQTGTPRHGEPA